MSDKEIYGYMAGILKEAERDRRDDRARQR